MTHNVAYLQPHTRDLKSNEDRCPFTNASVVSIGKPAANVLLLLLLVDDDDNDNDESDRWVSDVPVGSG